MLKELKIPRKQTQGNIEVDSGGKVPLEGPYRISDFFTAPRHEHA
jgi:hypothetical protein